MRVEATVLRHGDELTVIADGHTHRLMVHNPIAEAGESVAGGGKLTAPMPGRIVAVKVAKGAKVKRGRRCWCWRR